MRGGVLSLNGQGDFVELGTSFGNPASISLGGWINHTGTGRAEIISINDGVQLTVDEDGGLRASNSVNFAFRQELVSDEPISGNGWHHVFYVVDSDSDTQALYVDGRIVESGALVNDIVYSGATTTYLGTCLLYTSPSPRDQRGSRMPSSA